MILRLLWAGKQHHDRRPSGLCLEQLYFPFSATLRVQCLVETARIPAFGEDVHAAAGLTCAACHVSSRGAGALPIPARTAKHPCVPPATATRPGYAAVRSAGAQSTSFFNTRRSVTASGTAAADERVRHLNRLRWRPPHQARKRCRSPAAPSNVTTTCGCCHGDPARMSCSDARRLPGPTGLRVSMPRAINRGGHVCATWIACHGSHGATPPGDVRRQCLCVQCHVREAERPGVSPKKEIFDALGELSVRSCHCNH